MKRVYLTIAILFLGTVAAVAQTFEAINSESKLEVTGTSSLHDWECVVKEFTGKIKADVQSGKVVSISEFDFSFKAKSLESGKSGMDKKVYEALKEEANPWISYKGSSVVLKSDGTATFKGTMTIAGVGKSFETPVKVSYQNGKVSLIGEQSFKLTDFKIEPPTAVFGTIKTGDTVTIHYTIKLSTK